MNPDIPWKIVDRYFNDNPANLINHHIDSFDEFYSRGLPSILKEKNPIVFNKEYDDKTDTYAFNCNIYVGGRDGKKLYYGKPVVYDDESQHYMYPNDARMRNMTYGITVHYDAELEFKWTNESGKDVTAVHIIEKVFLGRFPVMVGSKLCITNGMSDTTRFQLGECRNDRGGYFILDGKERIIIPQERFADNMMYVREKTNDMYSHSVDIRSVSEDASKPVRTMSVRIVSPSPKFTNGQIVVNIPNVRIPIPLFIVMRALGVVSDTSIIEYCLLDIQSNNNYIDYFTPSIHDAGKVFDQETALKFIASFTKHKTVASALEIMTDYFLPHVGEMNFDTKAYFLGYMVKQMIDVVTGIKEPTDRDSFKYKRVDTTGRLLYDLFNEYYALQQREMFLVMDSDYFYHTGDKTEYYFKTLIEKHIGVLKKRTVEAGISKAYKGSWGGSSHTKKEGVVQVLNRLSFNSAISHLRKINLPLDASAKVVGPRKLHGSQFGIIDPVDTPDGGNIGLHKHMAIMAQITSGVPKDKIINWLTANTGLKTVEGIYPKTVFERTIVFVNGTIAGTVSDPKKTISEFKRNRRLGVIDVYSSISWVISESVIDIWSDGGRLTRPVYYVNEKGGASYNNVVALNGITNGSYSWNKIISMPEEEDDGAKSRINIKSMMSIVEYIDTNEQEESYICMTPDEFDRYVDDSVVVGTGHDTHKYTHIEIHPSFMLGVMGNQIVFPENNQLPRDLFSCGQSKQAVSLYHSNYQSRIDKMGVVLNSGQIPLVKSRYTKYISGDEHPYGENVVVAIMSYNGYNVEDSILFNAGSVSRGMFNMTYLNSYESYEETNVISKKTTNTSFGKIDGKGVVGVRPGYDYSNLDDRGVIRENTELNDKMVVIGRTTVSDEDPDRIIDSSVVVKKGQLGFVDKVYMTDGDEGHRIAKVRMRERRIPAIGDKFCSRCGQKGTVGLIIPESDMPFTSDGLVPDIIINPHAIPSRMTIGQLVESLLGKATAMYGGFGDCTAFVNNGPKHEMYGGMLRDIGFSSSGCHIMYNGMTGDMMESDIYLGPTYYMRLKHMVKDKINYRARGPRTVLTRQPVHGRANDGGLRIGEMERDGVVGHGAMAFLHDSMLERGDDYYMAVCNITGGIAVYNKSRNIFMSPDSDGPIQYKVDSDGNSIIDVVSKHGRSFSVVRVPYSFKLLLQELQVMNVRMRIITDDNINQIPELSYSKNMSLLTHDDDMTVSRVNVHRRFNKEHKSFDLPKTPVDSPELSPYVPSSPAYAPELSPYAPESPPYAPESPPYAPESPPYAPESPPYAPESPPYAPESPPYAPESPPYAPSSPDDTPDVKVLNIQDDTHDVLDPTDIESIDVYNDDEFRKHLNSTMNSDEVSDLDASDLDALRMLLGYKVEEDVNILTDIDNHTSLNESEAPDSTDQSDKKRVTIDLK